MNDITTNCLTYKWMTSCKLHSTINELSGYKTVTYFHQSELIKQCTQTWWTC